MKLIFKILINLVFLSLLATACRGGELTGLWQEYNDETGNPESLIHISKVTDNSYEARIEKILPDTAENSALLCTHCTGSLHNRPLLGLRILSGLKRRDKLSFEEGEIIDPDDGKIYRCNIRLSENDNTIEVTGYLSFNWIGHSEIWRRIK